MKIVRIVFLVFVLVIAAVLLGGFLLFNDWTRGPLPQHSGELTAPGLKDRVEILRDSWGVPHIYASSSYDLFFAQGYTHAQDRWWQMEFARHIGAGRIQELTGKNEAALGNDIAIRTMGWRHIAEREIAETYDEATLAILQAFADGVNAYILNRAPGDLALEYSVLGITGVKFNIEPWTLADTIVWGKAMAWNLVNDGSEMTRSRLYDALGETMTDQFMPAWPYGEKPTILQPEDLPLTNASLGAPPEDTAGIIGVQDQFAGNMPSDQGFMMGKGEGIGSNNWVVGGTMTATGKPLLANDMHLGLQMPSIWYEIGLHCQPVSEECPYNVVGFQFAPAPLITAGHNDFIAWGFTDHSDDVLDYYLIKVNPNNPLQYEWNGEWRDMTVREEVIHYGDSSDTLTIQVRETHLGPIINDNQIDAETGEIKGFNNENPRVMHWTALEPGALHTALVLLNKARNWTEFRDALRYWNVPSQNIVYADVEGNIGMQNPGQIPIRAKGHTGLLPVPGWTDEYEWKGFIPFDNLPRIFNPPRGYIATANQANVPLEYFDQLREVLKNEFGEDSNYVYAQEWAYGYRGQRIVEMLESLAPHTAETFRTILGDNKNISAAELMPYLAALKFNDAKLIDARDWLLKWDFQMHMDSPQAALYAEFWARLMDNLYADQLGDLTEASGGGRQMWSTFLLAEDPENDWWDDTHTTDVRETRDEILMRAFKEGYDKTVKALGENRESWSWGKLHTTTFASTPLGVSGIGLIENMVNRGPVATSGSTETVNAASWNAASGSFEVSSGVSERVIYDVSDWSKSVSIHTTGQSGHPYSEHYGDMIESWRQIEFKPMLWTREQVENAAVNKLTLKPGS